MIYLPIPDYSYIYICVLEYKINFLNRGARLKQPLIQLKNELLNYLEN